MMTTEIQSAHDAAWEAVPVAIGRLGAAIGGDAGIALRVLCDTWREYEGAGAVAATALRSFFEISKPAAGYDAHWREAALAIECYMSGRTEQNALLADTARGFLMDECADTVRDALAGYRRATERAAILTLALAGDACHD